MERLTKTFMFQFWWLEIFTLFCLVAFKCMHFYESPDVLVFLLKWQRSCKTVIWMLQNSQSFSSLYLSGSYLVRNFHGWESTTNKLCTVHYNELQFLYPCNWKKAVGMMREKLMWWENKHRPTVPRIATGKTSRLIPKQEGSSQGCVKVQSMIKGQTQKENTELLCSFTVALTLLGSPVTQTPARWVG